MPGDRKCTSAQGQENAHMHGDRKMHTHMGIGKCTGVWGQENAHVHENRKMHKYTGTEKCTQVWGQENALCFYPNTGVTVSFSHWLRSDLTVFHNLLVLKELAQRKRSRREKGPCLIHFSSENTAGPLCKLKFY